MSEALEQQKARKEERIPISGMTCAACSRRIEKVLNKMDGVEASVNLTTEEARVQYDPDNTKTSEIIERFCCK